MSKDNPYGSGGGTTVGYLVEARSLVGGIVVAERVLTNDWQRLSFHGVQFPLNGVPNDLYCALAKERGFLTHEAAMALAWWFLALPKAQYAVAVRLVKATITYSYTTAESGVGPEFSGLETARATPFVPREPAVETTTS